MTFWEIKLGPDRYGFFIFYFLGGGAIWKEKKLPVMQSNSGLNKIVFALLSNFAAPICDVIDQSAITVKSPIYA